ncbi:MAG: class I SAM-dependent methyltransferase [Acidobacteriota bacterium]|nr:class I SAM-dependent methyltransferase [Acidobacteriota bacterium]
MNCPLCKHPGKLFFRNDFFACDGCSGLYRNKTFYPTPEEERKRYEEHNNDVHDENFRKFVSPVTRHVLAHFRPDHRGLDFGSGTGPVVSEVLKGKGYDIRQYDPFFADDPALLRENYDYIVCCEVMEHFHDPDAEFRMLHRLLKSTGHLICMTHLYGERIEFKRWYYKEDKTHVFIYHRDTIRHIAGNYAFKDYSIDDRLIVFQK